MTLSQKYQSISDVKHLVVVNMFAVSRELIAGAANLAGDTLFLGTWSHVCYQLWIEVHLFCINWEIK